MSRSKDLLLVRQWEVFFLVSRSPFVLLCASKIWGKFRKNLGENQCTESET